jgi:hypothetical protein
MMVLLLYLKGKTLEEKQRSAACAILVAGSVQKLSNKFCGAMEQAAI